MLLQVVQVQVKVKVQVKVQVKVKAQAQVQAQVKPMICHKAPNQGSEQSSAPEAAVATERW